MIFSLNILFLWILFKHEGEKYSLAKIISISFWCLKLINFCDTRNANVPKNGFFIAHKTQCQITITDIVQEINLRYKINKLTSQFTAKQLRIHAKVWYFLTWYYFVWDWFNNKWDRFKYEIFNFSNISQSVKVMTVW